jgi:hypothetical protein
MRGKTMLNVTANALVVCTPVKDESPRDAKTLNTASKRFATATRNNGAKGLELILERIKAARVTGDIMPLIFLADLLGGSDGARVRAIAAWAFGDALKSRKDKKTGKIRYTFTAVDRAAAGNWIASTIDVLGEKVDAKVSFRGDVIGGIIAPAGAGKDAPEFDREKLLARVLKQLVDNGESVPLFAQDLIRLANAAKALAA